MFTFVLFPVLCSGCRITFFRSFGSCPVSPICVTSTSSVVLIFLQHILKVKLLSKLSLRICCFWVQTLCLRFLLCLMGLSLQFYVWIFKFLFVCRFCNLTNLWIFRDMFTILLLVQNQIYLIRLRVSPEFRFKSLVKYPILFLLKVPFHLWSCTFSNFH